ncbi:hypothetical protein OIO90_003882 [Microbotryomycetes sp. JL221]|nr:hypothetical protein OIO90_003882 [Microbotryomycetes sp. JL221]
MARPRRRLTSLAAYVWLALVAVGLSRPLILVAAQSANPDDPSGTPLYITDPACGFYQCSVTWQKGETVAVNWINPVRGQVSVELVSTIGGPTYTIVSSIPGTSQEGYCDSGYGPRVLAPGRECGRIRFTVPSGWQELVNYTIAVTSLDNPSIIGYTDNVNIVAAPKGSDAPSGTRISLVTIQGPTSTNFDAAVSNTGQVPSPTAQTRGGGGRDTSTSATSSSISSAASASTTAKLLEAQDQVRNRDHRVQ